MQSKIYKNYKKVKCPLCQKSNTKIIRKRLRYDIKRDVLQCQNCGLVFLRPKRKNLGKFYSQDYRRLHSPVLGKKLNSRQIFNIYLPFQEYRLKKIRPILNKKMHILDIGCSAGYFMYLIKDLVKECIGIELNEENAKFVNEELKIKVYSSPIEEIDLPFEHFDLILILQTLEHTENPIRFLKTVHKYLKPGGFLCVETPNIKDALMSLHNVETYRNFWFQEPHNFYFSPKTLLALLKICGFNGQISTVQSYNFLNHMKWIFTGRPQKSAELGMSKPQLVMSDSVKVGLKNELNCWIQKIDKEYKQILTKYNLGEFMIFIGRKK